MPKKKKSSKKIPFLKALSLRTKLLFATGLLFISMPTIFYINQTIQLTFFTPSVPYIERSQARPTKIVIPAVDMNLLIEETAIENNTWGVSQKGASHLTTSASPGEKGPIILYSHNTNERFGPIRWLKKGGEIEVTTADNKTHQYVITQTTIVDPNQTSIFLSNKDETLYLYTCDGFADIKRFIVIAKPKEISILYPSAFKLQISIMPIVALLR